jgi:hypothetical protein
VIQIPESGKRQNATVWSIARKWMRSKRDTRWGRKEEQTMVSKVWPLKKHGDGTRFPLTKLQSFPILSPDILFTLHFSFFMSSYLLNTQWMSNMLVFMFLCMMKWWPISLLWGHPKVICRSGKKSIVVSRVLGGNDQFRKSKSGWWQKKVEVGVGWVVKKKR